MFIVSALEIENITILQRKDTKKKYNFEEIVQTERNFIMTLETILKVSYLTTVRLEKVINNFITC